MKRAVLVFALFALVTTSGCFFRRRQPVAPYTGPTPSATPGYGTTPGAAAPAPATSASVGGQPRALLEDLERQMSSMGYRRVGPAQRNPNLATGNQMAYRVDALQGGCYVVVAIGAAGSNPNLIVRDPEGNNTAYDVDPDAYPWATFCPTQGGRHSVVVQMNNDRQGGEYYYAVYQGPPGRTVDLGAFFGRRAATTPAQTATANLDETFNLLAAEIQARGYESYGEPSRGQLTERAATDFAIELEGGKCYAVLAVGDAGVRDLDLVLLDSRGREIDRDIEADARPIVRVCPTRSGSFQMRVSMASGHGNFVYAPYRWPRGVRGPFGLQGLIYVRLGEVTSLLSQEGFEPDANYTPEKGTVQQGRSVTHQIDLQSGQCYSILAVGGDGVSDLSLTLKKDGQSLESDATRTAFPSVRHCPNAAGRYAVDIRADAGGGEYFYQVFHRGGS